MDDDEVIQTSDPEELEVTMAGKRQYWIIDSSPPTTMIDRKRSKLYHEADRPVFAYAPQSPSSSLVPSTPPNSTPLRGLTRVGLPLTPKIPDKPPPSHLLGSKLEPTESYNDDPLLLSTQTAAALTLDLENVNDPPGQGDLVGHSGNFELSGVDLKPPRSYSASPDPLALPVKATPLPVTRFLSPTSVFEACTYQSTSPHPNVPYMVPSAMASGALSTLVDNPPADKEDRRCSQTIDSSLPLFSQNNVVGGPSLGPDSPSNITPLELDVDDLPTTPPQSITLSWSSPTSNTGPLREPLFPAEWTPSPTFSPPQHVEPSQPQLSPLSPLTLASPIMVAGSSPSPHQHHQGSIRPVIDASGPSRENAGSDVYPETEDTAILQHFSRYALRTRQAKQLHPYAHDKLLYKKQMRANPDAIVKIVSPNRKRTGHHSHGSTDEEAEGLWKHRELEDEDANWEYRYGHRKRSSTNVSLDASLQAMDFPEILQGLPASDEEDKNMHAFSKNVLKILRKQRAKEQQEHAARRRTRLFPMRDRAFTAGSLPASGEGSPRLQPSRRTVSLSPPVSVHSVPHADIENSPVDNFNADDQDIHNNRGMPIEIDSNDGKLLTCSDKDVDQPSTDSDTRYEDDKRLRILKRMVPNVMLNKLITEQKRSAVSRRREIAQDRRVPSDSPLRPGQTKVRMSDHRKELRDIKGDIESSESDMESTGPPAFSSSSSDESDANHASRHVGRHQRRAPTPIEIITISDSEDQAVSSEEEVDDDDIRAYVADTTHSIESQRRPWRTLHEGSLIDWMLTRTRAICTKKAPRQKRKLNVVTTGVRKHGNTRQTHLDFRPSENHTSREPRHTSLRTDAQYNALSKARINRGQQVASSNAGVDRTTHVIHSSDVTLRQAKRKKKPRRDNKGQTYTFAHGGARIMSGRQKNVVTIDVEDEAFQRALVPQWQEGPTRAHLVAPLPHIAVPKASTKPGNDIGIQNVETDGKQTYQEITRDCSIPLLSSGIAFSPATYIGKGFLHELVTMIGGAEVPSPNAIIVCDFGLGPSTSVPQLVVALRDICEQLFEAATGLPEPDNGNRQWMTTMRAATRLVSWHSAHASEEDVRILRDAIIEQITRLIGRFEGIDLSMSSMDALTFSTIWLAVELLLRVGCQSPSVDSVLVPTDTIMRAASMLVKYLLRFGLDKTMERVLDREKVLGEGNGLADYTAELWICLIHATDALLNREATNSHLFWQLIMESLQQDVGRLSNLSVSELVWHTIFSLCALSQFSVHGMTMSTCRLPPCWELVIHALKQIRLTAHPTYGEELSEKSLCKRDEYIAQITYRCHHLVNQWRWPLNTASSVFNQIAEIFRSRKFENLRHELSDFPGFMLRHDLERLSQYEKGDTAFTLFLKLLVQVDNPGVSEDIATRRASPKLKKLLSLAIPVGAIPFTRESPPSVHELSMLYNRYSAVAVAVYLDPQSLRSRINLARTYVNFSMADDTTRIACIRGLMNLAIFCIQCRISLTELLPWLEDIVKCLVLEFDRSKLQRAGGTMEMKYNPVKDRTLFCVQILLGSIRRIFEAYNTLPSTSAMYPDPNLLSQLHPFFRNLDLVNSEKTALQIRLLTQSFLDVRAKIFPPPRSQLVTVPVEESQDEYGNLDLDLEDPELLAALGEEVDPSTQHHKEKDKLASDIIHGHIYPTIYRNMCQSFQKPIHSASQDEHRNEVGAWISCWLGCASVVVRNGKMPWSVYIERRDDSWGRITDTGWRRWVNLRVLLSLLQLDHTVYLPFQDLFIETAIGCLVVSSETIEHEYLSLLLSIDGLRHPLLRDIPSQLSDHGSDYSITTAEFLQLRLPCLKAIVSQIDRSLSQEVAGDIPHATNNHKYVGYLIAMFQTLHTELERLKDISDKLEEYHNWVQQVYAVFHGFPEVKSHHRLLYWMNLGRMYN